MRMTLMQSCEAVQIQQLPISGGLSGSIFPAVERWLEEDSDRGKALQEITLSEDLEYRSLIDCLLCETFQDLKPLCETFYVGRGLPLRDLKGPQELAMYERGLLSTCKVAYNNFRVSTLTLKKECKNPYPEKG